MSYAFNMGFIKVKKTDLLDFCTDFAKKCITNENSKAMFEKNVFYRPARRYGENKLTKREFDGLWLYRLFNLNFVYWEDKELLGLSGSKYSKELMDSLTLWREFQNSCDQNYDYKEWSGIDYFESVIQKIDLMTFEDFQLLDPDDDLSDYDFDLLYQKQSLVYKTIFKELELDNWLYGRDGKFKSFSINAIVSDEIHFHLNTILDSITKEWET